MSNYAIAQNKHKNILSSAP